MDIITSIIDRKNLFDYFIKITPFILAFVGIWLICLEYYNEKSWEDIFYIEDFARKSIRTRFHPDFVFYALLSSSFILLGMP